MLPVSAVLITREVTYPKDAWPAFGFDEILVETQAAGIRRRFDVALQARNDHIYVQDDDCSIDVAALFAQYDGQTLTAACSPGHQIPYNGTGVTLIGWGCFFPKRLINFTRWTDRYGPVPVVEWDRVFTFLAQPHKLVTMSVRHHRRDRAMSRDNADHYASRARVIARLQELR